MYFGVPGYPAWKFSKPNSQSKKEGGEIGSNMQRICLQIFMKESFYKALFHLCMI
jgi:hypothetical protein